MVARGAPLGNNNAAKGKAFRDALRLVIARRSRAAKRNYLDDLAERVFELALAGNMAAMKEIGDRLDGKPRRQSALSSDESVPPITRVERKIIEGAISD